MGILDLEPFLLRFANLLFVFERDIALPIVNTVTEIDFIGKDMLDLRRCPLIPFGLGLVLKNMSECSVPLKIDLCGSRDFFLFKDFADVCSSVTVCGKVEYLFDDPLVLGIEDQVSFLLGVFYIPDGSVSSVMSTAHKFGVQSRLDFLRCLSRVHLIEDVEERRDLALSLVAINSVGNGNIADVMRRKVDVYLLSRKDVVSAKSGKVFSNDTVDLSFLDVIKHPFKTGAVKVCTAVPIIHVFVVYPQALLVTELREHLSLR